MTHAMGDLLIDSLGAASFVALVFALVALGIHRVYTRITQAQPSVPEAEPVPARWRDKPWPNTRVMDSREIPEPIARAALEALTEGPRLRRVK